MQLQLSFRFAVMGNGTFHYMQGVLLTHDFRFRLEKPIKMKINR